MSADGAVTLDPSLTWEHNVGTFLVNFEFP